MRIGRSGWGIALWGALSALACTGPNPAFRLRVGIDSGAPTGGSGGSGGSGSGGSAGTIGGNTAGGAGGSAGVGGAASTAGMSPDGSVDSDPPGMDGPVLPETLPPDLAPAPDTTPPPDLSINPPVDMAPAVNLDDRLRAHWQFNEAAGTTQIADRIGNNAGVLQNGASLVASGIPNAGSGNRAARFQGNDDHMSITNRSLPTLQVTKSIALWINPDVLTHTGMRTIVALATSNDSSGIQIGTDGGRPGIWIWGASAAPVKYNGTWTDRWYHVVYTYEAQKHALYIDGALVGTTTNMAVTGTVGNAVLGCYDARILGSEMYEGLIDDVRIYDKVLSPTEIARLQQGE